jgi:hypothetical protein
METSKFDRSGEIYGLPPGDPELCVERSLAQGERLTADAASAHDRFLVCD